MTKPYRIRHKASGLYYQPAINHSNLSKKDISKWKEIWLGEENIYMPVIVIDN